MVTPTRICALADVPVDDSYLFTVRERSDDTPAGAVGGRADASGPSDEGVADGGVDDDPGIVECDESGPDEGVPDDGGPDDEVPDDGTLHEVLLLRTDGDVVAWRNHCQHFTDVRLDRGDGVTRRDDQIVCTNHGAYFEIDSGRCTFGPCEGAVLERVSVAVADGAVHLVDPDYAFVAIGGLERDPLDRSATGERGF